jgi:hypothetical protein
MYSLFFRHWTPFERLLTMNEQSELTVAHRYALIVSRRFAEKWRN